MYDAELDRFKRDVHLLRYAALRHGYLRDPRKSTRASHVLGHPTSGDKVVVRLSPDGHWTYFSVHDEDDCGTVIDFVLHRTPRASLGDVRKELRQWLGVPAPERDPWATFSRPASSPDPRAVGQAFASAHVAETSAYLKSRALRRETLSCPQFAGTWRVGRLGSVLFPHRDDAGVLTGFEIKSVGFTGFATGGTKAAWQSHARPDDAALVVCESAIDALSYHALGGPDAARSRYLSTAGAPGPRQLEVLARIFARLPAGLTVIAAVDRDAGGDRIATQLEALAANHAHLSFRRHSPERDKDWNEVLQRSVCPPSGPALRP